MWVNIILDTHTNIYNVGGKLYYIKFKVQLHPLYLKIWYRLKKKQNKKKNEYQRGL